MKPDAFNIEKSKSVDEQRSFVKFVASTAVLAGLLTQAVYAQTPEAGTQDNETPTSRTTATADPNQVLETVIVTGRAQELYRTTESSAGKLPTHPMDSSQVISAITKDLMEDQGARISQDLYRNISGVTVFSYGGVTARGFRQEENFYDGLRGDPYIAFSVPQLFNIERVEFLKGPAGMLYGQAAPGGIFNYVLKKPRFKNDGNLRLTLGDNSRYGISGQYTGPVSENVAARGGLFYESRDTQRTNADSEVFIGDAGMAFQFGGNMLNVQFIHLDTDLGGNRIRGVPVDDNGNFLASRRWNGNEKDDFLKLESTSAQFRWDGVIGNDITYDISGRYIDAEESQEYHNPRSLFDSDDDGRPDGVVREFRNQLRTNEVLSLGANAIKSTTFSDEISNRVLVGADYAEDQGYEEAARARGRDDSTPDSTVPTPLTFIDPQYGVANRANYTLRINNPGVDLVAEQAGIYLLNELTLGNFILTGGIRFDKFENSVENDDFSDEELTYRAGLVYTATPDLSFFGQYATSFEPQDVETQIPGAGGPFDPSQGDMTEVGMRAILFDGRLQSSLAIYRIERSNLIQGTDDDPEDDGVENYVSLGEVTSEGMDFDLAADITPDWVITVTYAYNDTQVTEDGGIGDVGDDGDRFANAPEHQFGLWTRYQFRPLGLAAAIGVDYIGERISRRGQIVKPYTVYDASLIYEKDDWKLLLRVDNLLDKTYASSGFTVPIGHFPGAPRSVFMELTRRL